MLRIIFLNQRVIFVGHFSFLLEERSIGENLQLERLIILGQRVLRPCFPSHFKGM